MGGWEVKGWRKIRTEILREIGEGERNKERRRREEIAERGGEKEEEGELVPEQ
ncbi:MAG: hypothetical protein ACOH1U_07280 [Rhodoglobus sp.]